MKLERRRAYNSPVEWNSSDEELLLNYLEENLFDSKNLKELFPNRTLPSIRSKVRKLRIKHDLFGTSYRSGKEEFTLEIAETIRPDVVFDAYAGAGHQSFKWIEYAETVYASEIMLSKLNQFESLASQNKFRKLKQKGNWNIFKRGTKRIYLYMGDALDAAADLKFNNVKVDVVDLDTCGSSLPLLPTILLLTKPKHLLITHGEFHSMRFKREDVLRRLLVHKDIKDNPLPMNVTEMSLELDKAVKTAALRAHNETKDSFWLELIKEIWLGGKFSGMLRRYYKVSKPIAASDCINEISII